MGLPFLTYVLQAPTPIQQAFEEMFRFKLTPLLNVLAM